MRSKVKTRHIRNSFSWDVPEPLVLVNPFIFIFSGLFQNFLLKLNVSF